MNRWMMVLMAVAAAGLTISVAGLVTIARRVQSPFPAPVAPDPGIPDMRVPEFTLVNQDGRMVDQHLFDGRVTVLDFMFTNCPFACPMMTMAMRDMASQFDPRSKVRFVSISVDPQRDTPQRLREYAAENGIDLNSWSLLTGDFATVKRIATGSLQFALEEEPSRPIALKDGTTMANIMHPTKLILVGPDRRVIGLYDSNDPEQVSALARRARDAAAAR